MTVNPNALYNGLLTASLVLIGVKSLGCNWTASLFLGLAAGNAVSAIVSGLDKVRGALLVRVVRN